MGSEPKSHYIHGSGEVEQERLSALNRLLNRRSLEALALQPGQKVLDVGSGLGQLPRAMAGVVGSEGLVVAVERDSAQLSRAAELAAAEGEADRVDMRLGDAADLPLREEEWGTFDVVHSRFLLEHVERPEDVIEAMLWALRPGGRIVLEDDDPDQAR